VTDRQAEGGMEEGEEEERGGKRKEEEGWKGGLSVQKRNVTKK